MPLIQCNFFSQALELSVSMDVILPLRPWKPQNPVQDHKHPTLYLLHGLSDDHTIWQRRTSIERYVENHDLAVVMPAVQRSFYTDMKIGPRFWTFISQELPFVAQSLFPLSAAREDNFVAGLSMGGYGALKLALSCPERFAAAASFSGLTDITMMYKDPDPRFHDEISAVFGSLEEARNSPNDLFWLARKIASPRYKGPKPRLYQWCGQQDFLYASNVKFRKHAERLGLDLTYAEGPGDHTWKYWDEQIQVFLTMIDPAPLEEK